MVESAALLCYDMAASKGLELSWFVEPSLPPALLIDATRLQQVLLNTLSNAIKVRRHGVDAPGGGQRMDDSARGAAFASWRSALLHPSWWCTIVFACVLDQLSSPKWAASTSNCAAAPCPPRATLIRTISRESS